MKYVLYLLCGIAFACVDSVQAVGVNVWRKVSTDPLNPGQILELDMSKGYSFAADGIIYIVVMTTDSSEQIVAIFPDKGYWTAPKSNPFLEELDKEFKSLEEYLKNKGTEIKKK